MYSSTLFLTSALEGGEGSASRPGRTLPPGKTRYPLYRRLDGPEGRSGQARKISPPPGFDPRTVQPVGSHYTDWAIRPTKCILTSLKYLSFHHRCRLDPTNRHFYENAHVLPTLTVQGTVVTTIYLALLYSGSSRFETRPEHGVPCFRGPSQNLQTNSWQYLD
jgi:hypothetical protein